MDKKTDRRLYIEIGLKLGIIAALVLLGVFVPAVQFVFLAVLYYCMKLPPLALLLVFLYIFFWYVPFFRYEDFNSKKALQRSLFAVIISIIIAAYFVSGK